VVLIEHEIFGCTDCKQQINSRYGQLEIRSWGVPLGEFYVKFIRK